MYDRDAIKRFTKAFHPFRDLTVDEIRTLAVHRVDDQRDRILFALQSAADPGSVRLLLAGPRGVGKSQTLRSIASALSVVPPTGAPSDAFVPVVIDIGAELPKQCTTAAWLPRLLAAVRAMRIEWGEPVNLAEPASVGAFGLRGWFSKLVTALPKAGVMLTLVELGLRAAAPDDPALEAAAATTKRAREALDQIGEAGRVAAAHAPEPPELRLLIDDLATEVQALSTAAGRPVALLLDGLDKRPTAEAVFEALSDVDLLTVLPCALVLTGPTALTVDQRFGAQLVPGAMRSYLLPVMHVVARDGTIDPVGAQAMVELFRRRWDGAQLGPCPFGDEALCALARWSSGLPRTFLELVNETYRVVAMRHAAEVTDADIEEAVRQSRHPLEATLNAATARTLTEALRTGVVPTGEVHADLLMNNLLITRLNGATWCRPNELLIPLLEELARRTAPTDPGARQP